MKKNTWNVRRLDDESFAPSPQETSVLYCRLSDFRIQPENRCHVDVLSLVELSIPLFFRQKKFVKLDT